MAFPPTSVRNVPLPLPRQIPLLSREIVEKHATPQITRFTYNQMITQKDEFLVDYRKFYRLPSDYTTVQVVQALCEHQGTVPALPIHIIQSTVLGPIIVGRSEEYHRRLEEENRREEEEADRAKKLREERDAANKLRYGNFPTERFPSPFDEFSEKDEEPPEFEEVESEDGSYVEAKRNRLKIVFPPEGRLIKINDDGTEERADLGPYWIEDMLAGVVQSKHEAEEELAEAKLEVREALAEITSLKLQLDDGLKAQAVLLDDLEKLIGKNARAQLDEWVDLQMDLIAKKETQEENVIKNDENAPDGGEDSPEDNDSTYQDGDDASANNQGAPKDNESIPGDEDDLEDNKDQLQDDVSEADVPTPDEHATDEKSGDGEDVARIQTGIVQRTSTKRNKRPHDEQEEQDHGRHPSDDADDDSDTIHDLPYFAHRHKRSKHGIVAADSLAEITQVAQLLQPGDSLESQPEFTSGSGPQIAVSSSLSTTSEPRYAVMRYRSTAPSISPLLQLQIARITPSSPPSPKRQLRLAVHAGPPVSPSPPRKRARDEEAEPIDSSGSFTLPRNKRAHLAIEACVPAKETRVALALRTEVALPDAGIAPILDNARSPLPGSVYWKDYAFSGDNTSDSDFTPSDDEREEDECSSDSVDDDDIDGTLAREVCCDHVPLDDVVGYDETDEYTPPKTELVFNIDPATKEGVWSQVPTRFISGYHFVPAKDHRTIPHYFPGVSAKLTKESNWDPFSTPPAPKPPVHRPAPLIRDLRHIRQRSDGVVEAYTPQDVPGYDAHMENMEKQAAERRAKEPDYTKIIEKLMQVHEAERPYPAYFDDEELVD
ncbi:hypothetical protein BDQ12DRAFT_113675 [Crucibulum laeve]|uniref:Uncharacterized protein n=1 Tax=Crucibulum laeve TaxID=68775 RepID=A0A5C3M2B3_9AGAR|nr:hypothetical protein BDQ12DRAFT_113675 [Crucibulum laeve]